MDFQRTVTQLSRHYCVGRIPVYLYNVPCSVGIELPSENGTPRTPSNQSVEL
jgi:hypothetical protein